MVEIINRRWGFSLASFALFLGLLFISIDPLCAQESGSAEGAGSLEAPEMDLATLSADELKQELDGVNERAKQAAVGASELKGQLWELRRETRRSDEGVAEVQAELRLLKQKIEKLIDEAPAVKSKAEELESVQTELLELARTRQHLLQAIQARAKDPTPSETE